MILLDNLLYEVSFSVAIRHILAPSSVNNVRKTVRDFAHHLAKFVGPYGTSTTSSVNNTNT